MSLKPPVYISQWSAEGSLRRNDCGPACVAMFSRAQGNPTKINELPTNEKTGLTDAPELVRLFNHLGIQAQILRGDPKLPLNQAVPRYTLLLVNYDPLRRYAQDTQFTGWHWVVYLGEDKNDPSYSYVHDPDFSGDRINEGSFKRYLTSALRSAFRPYPGRTTTTAIHVLDVEDGDLPVSSPVVYTKMYVNAAPKYTGVNIRTLPDSKSKTLGSGYSNGDEILVDLHSLTKGYVKLQSTGWVLYSLLSSVKPAPKPPSTPGRKPFPYIVPRDPFGWHINYDSSIDKVILPYSRDLKGLIGGYTVVNMPALANQLAKEGNLVMYRQFIEPDATYKTSWLNGKTPAEAYQLGYDFYYQGPHRSNIVNLRKEIFIKLINECGYHPLDVYFTMGMMVAAEKEGRVLAIFGDSSGGPEIYQMKTREPALIHAKEFNHVLTLNHYGRTGPKGEDAPYPVADDEGYLWFGGRFIQFYDAMENDNSRPYIIFGETGASASSYNQPFAVDDAGNYAVKLKKGKYGNKILFFSLFTLGQWRNCNLIGQLDYSRAIVKKLAYL